VIEVALIQGSLSKGAVLPTRDVRVAFRSWERPDWIGYFRTLHPFLDLGLVTQTDEHSLGLFRQDSQTTLDR
jgi:hypothetical protein